MKWKHLSLSQQILLFVLYSSLILVIIFSLMATQNTGYDGYNSCMKANCAEKGPGCYKIREISNCCLGAGGELGVINNNNYTCIFSS